MRMSIQVRFLAIKSAANGVYVTSSNEHAMCHCQCLRFLPYGINEFHSL